MAKLPLVRTRGIRDRDELSEENLVRDTRGFFGKTFDFLAVKQNMVITLICLAVTSFVFYGGTIFVFILSLLLMWHGLTRREEGAMKLPVQSGMLDPVEGGSGKPKKAAGIFFIGNDRVTGKEVWFTNSDARTHFIVLGTTGAGKALPLDALVHTPTGWRRMADIVVGSWVSTPDGRSARVDGVFPQGELDILEIEFEDGRLAEACPEHLWEVHHKHWNGKYKPGVSRAGAAVPRLLRTKEIAELLERNAGKFSIRLPQAVEKPSAALPLDPYLVGALLGDGDLTGKSFRFSSADLEITETVGRALAAVGCELHRYEGSATIDYHVRLEAGSKHTGPNPGRLRLAIRELGLEEVDCFGKFIPEIYREASVAQRWALVQGLMDTDGTCDHRKVALTFSSSSMRLATDFQEVVRSLGGMASISVKHPFYRDRHGERKDGQPSYTVSIRHPEPDRFFSLPRKVALASRPYQYATTLKLGIKAIRFKRRAQAACIRIDHPEHLFITNDYVVTHNTETLLGFAANALSWGSGFLFVDGKGDVSLYAKAYALTRRMGREDDLLVMNFMTGGTDVLSGGGGVLRSNTLNPFTSGSSDQLTQMCVSLMDDAGGDGAVWKGRAVAMLGGIMRALVWKRDQGELDLNIGIIRDYLALEKIIELAADEMLPPNIRNSIVKYIAQIPGFDKSKGTKQAQQTMEQHGYLQMQFSKVLATAADVYGFIFMTPFGEIDMADVVLNRRILIVMLPSLEKSPLETENLGKIVVANLKGMMGQALGDSLTGSWQNVVEKRVTNSPSPFVVILDEVGYYMVEGMDMMAAQARSLGFCLVFAGQDVNAMKKKNEKVADAVISNCNTTIAMKVEDAGATADLIVKKGGKALRAFSAGFDANVGEIGMRYSDRNSAEIKEVDKINFLDLKGQDEGEMHVVWKTRLVRAKGFYVNPPEALNKNLLNMAPNQFLKVARPNPEDVSLKQRLPAIAETLARPDHVERMRRAAEELTGSLEADAREGNEIAVCALAITAVRTGKNPRDRTEAAAASVAAMLRAQKGKAHEVGGDIRALDSLKAFDSPAGASAGLGLGNRAQGRQGMPTGAPQRGRGLGVVDPYEQMADDGVPPGHMHQDPQRQPQKPVRQQPPAFEDADDMDAIAPVMTAPPPVRRQAPPPRTEAVGHSVDVDDDIRVDMASDPHRNEIMTRFLSALDSEGGAAGVQQEIDDSVSSLHGYHPAARTAEAPTREMENARRISDAAAGRGQWPVDDEPVYERERERELETAGGPSEREERKRAAKPAPLLEAASNMGEFFDALLEDEEGH
jgi:hypothetical protein